MPVEFISPTLLMIAGSNGAGKSTLFKERVAPLFSAPFINADVIQKDEIKDPRAEASYVAAQIATERRNEFLSQSKSFVTESVFSHPSKIELIREAKKTVSESGCIT